MAWHSRFTWPLEALSDLQRDVMVLRMAVLQLPVRLARIEAQLARIERDDETPAD